MPVQRIGFCDIDQQAAQLVGHDQEYQQISPGRFQGAFTTAALGTNAWLFIEDTNQALIQHGSTPANQSSFMFLLSEGGWCRFQGSDFTSSDLALLAGGGEYAVRCPTDSRFCVITVDNAALLEVFDLDNPGVGTTRRLNSPQMATIVGALRSLVLTSFSLLSGDTNTARQRTILINLRRAVVSTIGLALSTHRCTSALPDLRLFRRACDIVQAELREIDVSSLCRTLEIPRRTLELTFHGELGIGPARYIKTMRLNQIRREIVASGSVNRPLADIAANWGLWHPSHFSESYAAMFGELPSHSRVRWATVA